MRGKVLLTKLPKLRLRWRILLYLLTIFVCGLSIWTVTKDELLEKFSLICYICYAFAAILLSVSCIYVVKDVRHGVKDEIKPLLASNTYTKQIMDDYRLRVFVFSVPGLLGNILFAGFNAVMAVYAGSAWLGSMAGYYILLSIMRFGTVWQEKENALIEDKEERYKAEISIYKVDSILFIFMAVTLVWIVTLLGRSIGGKKYPGTLIYAVAFYTFYRIVISIINMVKVGKYRSPLLSMVRRIGYADACVSLLMLQTAMFASFSEGKDSFNGMMNEIVGGVICAMIAGIGIYGMAAVKKLGRNIQHDSDISSRG